MNENSVISNKISSEQLQGIRFYMGDPEIVASGIYKGGPKAYNTINALLHPGTANEKEKILEGKTIALESADHLKSYLKLIQDIVLAMEIYRFSHASESVQNQISYRIDRASAIEGLKNDDYKIAGFFSTCKYGFLPQYANTKADIVMMEIHRDASVPYLDFSDLFQVFYAKPEEAEILLPFGSVISKLEQIPLSEEEKQTFKDRNGNFPHGKWQLELTAGNWELISETEKESCFSFITDEKSVSSVQECISVLMKKSELTEEDEKFYCEWKKQLQRYLVGCIASELQNK